MKVIRNFNFGDLKKQVKRTQINRTAQYVAFLCVAIFGSMYISMYTLNCYADSKVYALIWSVCIGTVVLALIVSLCVVSRIFVIYKSLKQSLYKQALTLHLLPAGAEEWMYCDDVNEIEVQHMMIIQERQKNIYGLKCFVHGELQAFVPDEVLWFTDIEESVLEVNSNAIRIVLPLERGMTEG